MLSNAEMMMGVVHEAQVRQATAYSEHRFTARVLARGDAKPAQPVVNGGWKVWNRLGGNRGGRKAA